MATVEVVSAKSAFHEDTNEASSKTEQEKITQEEVIDTPTLAPKQTKEEEVIVVTKTTKLAAPEGKPSDEVETKYVAEIEAKVEAVTITQEPTVEKIEEESKKEEAETEVVEETNENNVDPAVVEVVKEDKVAEPEAKDKDNEEKVDTEASDEKKEEEVVAAEVDAKKSEEVIDAPSDEKSE